MLIVAVAFITLLAPRILRWLEEFFYDVFTSASYSQSSAVSHLQTKRPDHVGLQMSDKQLTVFNKVDKCFHTHAQCYILRQVTV